MLETRLYLLPCLAALTACEILDPEHVRDPDEELEAALETLKADPSYRPYSDAAVERFLTDF